MTSKNGNCPDKFDESLLSALLDGELTQQEKQKVDLHIEKCSVCNSIYEELKEIRELTLGTNFTIPPDEQWDEKPRNMFSTLARISGWCIIIVWAAIVAVFLLWQLFICDESIWEKVAVFSIITGISGLFISVLIDRLKNLKNDKYTKVQK